MSIETRLAKLEALRLRLLNATQPLNISVFGVNNGLPDGYACGDVLIYREAGETMAELQARCRESIPLADVTTLNFFEPF